MEILFTGVLSLGRGDTRLVGNTSLWMFPIYGSAVFLEPIHNSIRVMPVIYRGGVYLVLIWVAEYFSGWVIKKIIGQCPWDLWRETLSGRADPVGFRSGVVCRGPSVRTLSRFSDHHFSVETVPFVRQKKHNL